MLPARLNIYHAYYGLFQNTFKTFVLILCITFTSSFAYADTYKILAFGDSLSAGYGLERGQSFPDKLARKLADQGYDVQMINAGVSGDTTSGGLNRLEWTLGQNPDLVLLALGANDALRFINPDIVRDNLDRMLEIITARSIDVVLIGMYAPRNQGDDYTARFDAIYPELAEKYNVPLYPFILEGVATNPNLNISDGLHPNEKGTEIIADNILPLVIPFLDNKSR